MCSAYKPGWGDSVSDMLKKVGITKEKVEALIGKPCGCEERREKLNRLGEWVKRTFG